MRELAARGLAHEVPMPGGARFQVSAEGAKLMSDAMARNGRRAREWNEARSRG